MGVAAAHAAVHPEVGRVEIGGAGAGPAAGAGVTAPAANAGGSGSIRGAVGEMAAALRASVFALKLEYVALNS